MSRHRCTRFGAGLRAAVPCGVRVSCCTWVGDGGACVVGWWCVSCCRGHAAHGWVVVVGVLLQGTWYTCVGGSGACSWVAVGVLLDGVACCCRCHAAHGWVVLVLQWGLSALHTRSKYPLLLPVPHHTVTGRLAFQSAPCGT